MWPAIYKAAIAEANRLYNEENKDIVVLEAAALVKANWKKKVHEVWSAIIPQEEVRNFIINYSYFKTSVFYNYIK